MCDQSYLYNYSFKKIKTLKQIYAKAPMTTFNFTTCFDITNSICIDSIRVLVDQVPWILLNFILYISNLHGYVELAKWSHGHFYFGRFGPGIYPPSVVYFLQ